MTTALKYGLIAAAMSTTVAIGAFVIDYRLEKEPECSNALRSEFKQAIIGADTPMSVKSGQVQLELEDGSTCNMRLNY